MGCGGNRSTVQNVNARSSRTLDPANTSVKSANSTKSMTTTSTTSCSETHSEKRPNKKMSSSALDEISKKRMAAKQGRRDKYAIDNLKAKDFFIGTATEIEAEEKLRDDDLDLLLYYRMEQPTIVSTTVQLWIATRPSTEKVLHFPLKKDARYWSIDSGENEPIFDSLTALVNYNRTFTHIVPK